MSFEDYYSAMKAGQKEYRQCVSRGEYPYLQVLDEILGQEQTQGEQALGLVRIPIEQIAGTKTEGRRTAFAKNFMPLLPTESEFAVKWIALSDAHLKDGIRDPITAYEYMNRFYVAEGNKRVSVLKFFGAATVTGKVTRIVPKRTDSNESLIYYEYMDFYRITQINYIWFSQPGRFKGLLAATGTGEEPWSAKQRSEFYFTYTMFRKAFHALGGEKLAITPGDAMLAYMKIYGYAEMLDSTQRQMRENLTKSWPEIAVQSDEEPVEFFLSPDEESPRSATKALFDKILSSRPPVVKAAFLHEKTAESSKWTYSHEQGRRQLERALGGRVETVSVENVKGENAREIIERAAEEGNRVIFTTSPKLISATLHAAAEHAEVEFLNCSLNVPHPLIRTYYGRLYEAKFLSGLIAGTLSEKGRIGFIADYPIYGTTANVNAFAAGVQMVNPRAVVYLEWLSRYPLERILRRFRNLGTDVISNQDMLSPRRERREFGLYKIGCDSAERVAVTYRNWGRFYELILRNVLEGGRRPAAAKAVNYWWGLSAGVVDIHYSKKLPAGTRRLVEFMREALVSGAFRPFAGPLRSAEGMVLEEGELSAEQIVKMNFLLDNVRGDIPHVENLTPESQELVRLLGIRDEEREGTA